MKFSIPILLVVSLEAASLAQGLVNFNNTPTTFITMSLPEGGTAPISGPAGSYYFALLIAPTNSFDLGSFTFSGIYATNLNQSGLFDGGTVAVPGWTPGTARNYFIEGWPSQMGHDWQASWFTQGNTSGSFGASALGTGIAGGFDGTRDIPSLDLFSALPGISSGFNLYPFAGVLIPEPSVLTLSAIGFAVVLAARKKRFSTNSHK